MDEWGGRLGLAHVYVCAVSRDSTCLPCSQRSVHSLISTNTPTWRLTVRCWTQATSWPCYTRVGLNGIHPMSLIDSYNMFFFSLFRNQALPSNWGKQTGTKETSYIHIALRHFRAYSVRPKPYQKSMTHALPKWAVPRVLRETHHDARFCVSFLSRCAS